MDNCKRLFLKPVKHVTSHVIAQTFLSRMKVFPEYPVVGVKPKHVTNLKGVQNSEARCVNIGEVLVNLSGLFLYRTVYSDYSQFTS